MSLVETTFPRTVIGSCAHSSVVSALSGTAVECPTVQEERACDRRTLSGGDVTELRDIRLSTGVPWSHD
eukprot:SAG11_NODE_32864_length_280_cov_0.856354_1_plen_68_part_01